jgi:hypothetical protein
VRWFALWYPYECGTAPEWRLQVVGQNGKVAVGAQVNQEWLNPIDEGMVMTDSRTTDGSGVVLFPRRVLKSRLALGFVHTHPSSRVLVCWQGQFGDVNWDGAPGHLAARLGLEKGDCPYD